MAATENTPVDRTFRLSSALKRALSEDADMPIRYLLTLLIIKSRGSGITQAELADILGITKGGASKIAAKLGDWYAYKVPGLRLIRTEEDLVDRRLKKMYLTEKGRRFVHDVENEL